MQITVQSNIKGCKAHAVVFREQHLSECGEYWPILKKMKPKDYPGAGTWKSWNCLESGMCFVMENLSLGHPKDDGELKKIFQSLNQQEHAKVIYCYGHQLHFARKFAQILEDSLFLYQEFLSNPKKIHFKECYVIGKDRHFKHFLEQGQKIGEAMFLTRTLAETPPNECTPAYLGKKAMELEKKYTSIEVSILGLKEIKALKMNSFISVSKGSAYEPKFISVKYQNGLAKEAPVVLIGKGITYDTGGHSLKPSNSMMGMKFDMSGAATVLGMMKLIAELELNINVIGLIPTCENIPGGDANKPDDIVISMSGQTIEILNTDAEGRLILCDAMTYAERFEPRYVIDIATLTGSCVATFGTVATGLMGNDQELIDLLLEASKNSGDKAWPLPLWDEYDEELKSPVADMANIGGSYSGAITAGCFLKRFATKYKWAHLDVAGTACIFQGHKRGSTGRPIPLLAEFFFNLIGE